MVVRYRSYAALLALCALPACSMLTDTDGPASAQVEVDPTVIQTVLFFGTGDSIVNDPAIDIDEIGCLRENPRTCWVKHFVRATVHNTGERTLMHHARCGGPLQRRLEDGGWNFVAYLCALIFIPPVEIEAGGRHHFVVGASQPAGQYRLVVTLYDGSEELPMAMRTSRPFLLSPH